MIPLKLLGHFTVECSANPPLSYVYYNEFNKSEVQNLGFVFVHAFFIFFILFKEPLICMVFTKSSVLTQSLTAPYSHHPQSVSTICSECRHVYLLHLGYAGTLYRDSFSFRNEKISGK